MESAASATAGSTSCCDSITRTFFASAPANPKPEQVSRYRAGYARGGAGSILVVEDKRIRLRSDAVLRLLSLLGFPLSLLGIFRLIPAAVRGAVYNLIARNRKRWFGKTTQCRIPAPSERHRFL